MHFGTASIAWPLLRSGSVIDPTADTRVPPSDGRRPIVVLLVDDQAFIGAALGVLLRSEPDIDLHCCLWAVNAVALANQIAPTLILQDLIMPDIDGLTLVRAFRANPRFRPPTTDRGFAPKAWFGDTSTTKLTACRDCENPTRRLAGSRTRG